MAADISNRIVAAIGKHGHTWTWRDTFKEEAVKELGELGYYIIAKRGWRQICEESNHSDLPNLRAQIREFAEALIEKQKLGIEIDTMPTLSGKLTPALPSTHQSQLGQTGSPSMQKTSDIVNGLLKDIPSKAPATD